MIQDIIYESTEKGLYYNSESLVLKGFVCDDKHYPNVTESRFSIELVVIGKDYDSDLLILIKNNILGAKSFLDIDNVGYISSYERNGSQEEVCLGRKNIKMVLSCELYSANIEIAKCLGVIVSSISKNNNLFLTKDVFNKEK